MLARKTAIPVRLATLYLDEGNTSAAEPLLGYIVEQESTPAIDELLARADYITVHVPLNKATHHLLNAEAFAKMKDGVMLINTSRGGLVDTRALICGLKSGKIGSAGLDVYEEEGDLFFEDISDQIIEDDVFARVLCSDFLQHVGHSIGELIV